MDINENLIGLWRLNTGAGLTAFDTSGNGNDGTLEGTTPTWIDGKSGKAVNLPGVNERIDCGNGAPLNALGNASFWLSFQMKSKDTVPNNYGMLFSKTEDATNQFFFSSYTTNNRLNLTFRKGGVGIVNSPFGVATTPFDTIWNHIVLSINRVTNKALLYMNKIQDATEIDISTVPADGSNLGPVIWGGRTADLFFEGGLDELRIYTGEPTQAKIDFLHTFPNGIDPGEMIAADVYFTESLSSNVLLTETQAADVALTESIAKGVR